MSLAYEELDYCQTELGELILRRRTALSLGGADVFEVKLAGEFLMSSAVNDSEVALAQIPLADWPGSGCDVLVGGLGLGHTAHSALQFPCVRSVTVAERLAEVIAWHHRGLVPLAAALRKDPRCTLLHADFFALVRDGGTPRFGAILLDIDHAPGALLHPDHAAFYEPAGLAALRDRLIPGGVFALWSSTPAPGLEERLHDVFARVTRHDVEYYHPMLDRDETNVIYVARGH